VKCSVDVLLVLLLLRCCWYLHFSKCTYNGVRRIHVIKLKINHDDYESDALILLKASHKHSNSSELLSSMPFLQKVP
jgi:hypothetical protein